MSVSVDKAPNNQPKRPNIDDAILIQVDAAIIAGILILLTLSSITFPEETLTVQSLEMIINAIRGGLTLVTIFPFSYSAAIILRGNFAKTPSKDYLTKASRLMMIGFYYIISTIAVIVGLNILPSFYR